MERAQQELAQGLEWGVVAVVKDRDACQETRLVLGLPDTACAQNAESA